MRIWDPATGTPLAALEGHIGSVNTLCAYTQDGQPRLASAADDDIGGGTVRIWDPATGTQLAALEGHIGSVNTLCPYTQDGQPRLASGGDDRTVRIWAPATGVGQIVLVIPVYHRVLALTYETGLLCLGFSGGMLTIQV